MAKIQCLCEWCQVGDNYRKVLGRFVTFWQEKITWKLVNESLEVCNTKLDKIHQVSWRHWLPKIEDTYLCHFTCHKIDVFIRTKSLRIQFSFLHKSISSWSCEKLHLYNFISFKSRNYSFLLLFPSRPRPRKSREEKILRSPRIWKPYHGWKKKTSNVTSRDKRIFYAYLSENCGTKCSRKFPFLLPFATNRYFYSP